MDAAWSVWTVTRPDRAWFMPKNLMTALLPHIDPDSVACLWKAEGRPEPGCSADFTSTRTNANGFSKALGCIVPGRWCLHKLGWTSVSRSRVVSVQMGPQATSCPHYAEHTAASVTARWALALTAGRSMWRGSSTGAGP